MKGMKGKDPHDTDHLKEELAVMANHSGKSIKLIEKLKRLKN